MDSKVLAAAQAFLQKQPGVLSFLVVRRGVLVQESYFSGSAMDHSTNIHSAAKGILGALVGLALEQGILNSLDAPLSELLSHEGLTPAKQAITLRQLLCMTSGWQWTEDKTEAKIESQANWIKAIVALPLATSPGTTFNYNTGVSHLISAVLTKATGLSTAEFAKQALFEPLGITFEHWGKDPQGVSSGGFNVYMTPRALAKFAHLALCQGQLPGQPRLLSESWFAESWLPRATVDDEYSYGYLWWLLSIGGHRTCKQWGFGGQFVMVLPDDELCLILTTDTARQHREPLADRFAADYLLPSIRS